MLANLLAWPEKRPKRSSCCLSNLWWFSRSHCDRICPFSAFSLLNVCSSSIDVSAICLAKSSLLTTLNADVCFSSSPLGIISFLLISLAFTSSTLGMYWTTSLFSGISSFLEQIFATSCFAFAKSWGGLLVMKARVSLTLYFSSTLRKNFWACVRICAGVRVGTSLLMAFQSLPCLCTPTYHSPYPSQTPCAPPHSNALYLSLSLFQTLSACLASSFVLYYRNLYVSY